MGEIIDKAKGKAKEAVGTITGNEELVREGKRDQVKGEVKGAIADLKGTAKDTAHAVKQIVK